MSEHLVRLADLSDDVDIVDDVGQAIRLAAADRRVVLMENGGRAVALLPVADLRLLLRLEDEELDRVDAQDVRQLRKSKAYHDRVSWDDVKLTPRL